MESSNFTDIKPKILFDTVRTLYPDFKYTVQNRLADGTPHRMFIYLPETQIGKYNNDTDIGCILGFHCRGLPDPDMVTWISNYKLVINGMNLIFIQKYVLKNIILIYKEVNLMR